MAIWRKSQWLAATIAFVAAALSMASLLKLVDVPKEIWAVINIAIGALWVSIPFVLFFRKR